MNQQVGWAGRRAGAVQGLEPRATCAAGATVQQASMACSPPCAPRHSPAVPRPIAARPCPALPCPHARLPAVGVCDHEGFCRRRLLHTGTAAHKGPAALRYATAAGVLTAYPNDPGMTPPWVPAQSDLVALPQMLAAGLEDEKAYGEDFEEETGGPGGGGREGTLVGLAGGAAPVPAPARGLGSALPQLAVGGSA